MRPRTLSADTSVSEEAGAEKRSRSRRGRLYWIYLLRMALLTVEVLISRLLAIWSMVMGRRLPFSRKKSLW
jgi:hypothetical protein